MATTRPTVARVRELESTIARQHGILSQRDEELRREREQRAEAYRELTEHVARYEEIDAATRAAIECERIIDHYFNLEHEAERVDQTLDILQAHYDARRLADDRSRA